MTAPRYTITPMHGAKLDSEGEWMRAEEVLATPVPITVTATYLPFRLKLDEFVCDVRLTIGGRLWAGEARMVTRSCGYHLEPLYGVLRDAVPTHPKVPIERLIAMACETAIAACVN